jgi:hypothetical protein
MKGLQIVNLEIRQMRQSVGGTLVKLQVVPLGLLLPPLGDVVVFGPPSYTLDHVGDDGIEEG